MHRSSYCGINCEKCKVYIATLTDDADLKLKVIEEWGVLYERKFKQEDMVCHGCKSENVFMLCSLCDIKNCNKNRKIENCEDCDDFPCERMNKFFEYHQTHDFGSAFD